MEDSNFTNITEDIGDTSHPKSSYVVGVTVCLAIMFAVGLLLNSVSMNTIVKTKKMQPTYMLILNLAFADFLYMLG